MRTSDTTDVSSLVSYINDIKPFHSKLTEVVVEYQANDNMNVAIVDKDYMDIHMSSVWQLEEVSDGIQTRYRIPAAVMPRYSEDFHQSDRVGVTDEIPGQPGAYHVPNNAALEVLVNGFPKTLGFDYTVNADRTTVQFMEGRAPVLGDKVTLNWAVMDRVFLGLGTNPIVWQSYDLVYDSENSTYDMVAYDEEPIDGDVNGLFFNGEGSAELFVSPFGYVRVEYDTKGLAYYVFDFIKPLDLDTTFWIRVEQREAYNGWTQTTITDTVKFADTFRMYDTVNVQIADPNSYLENIGLFGININTNKDGYYDVQTFDTMVYDSLATEYEIGYYKLFDITEQMVPQTQNAKFVEGLGVTVSQWNFYDTEAFDTDTYDGSSVVSVMLQPDANGMVRVTRPATTVTIFHDSGYQPMVSVYVDNALYMPLSVKYLSANLIEIDFAEAVMPIIRLV